MLELDLCGPTRVSGGVAIEVVNSVGRILILRALQKYYLEDFCCVIFHFWFCCWMFIKKGGSSCTSTNQLTPYIEGISGRNLI